MTKTGCESNLNHMRPSLFVSLLGFLLVLVSAASAQGLPARGEWKTDLSKASIDLADLHAGGPPKDGIPAIREPKFVSVGDARSWVADKEPVMVVEAGGEVRIYPIQILIWHEMVNDVIGDLSVLVSYCPLCNSAIVFDRTIDGKVYDFGVSGMLRHSDMIMFDRQTDSLWQQLTGEAVVGELLGKRLWIVSSQMVNFGSARASYPQAQVLSKDTGFQRAYGSSPYAGYDMGGRTMFPVPYQSDGQARALDRLVTIQSEDGAKAHLLADMRKARVRADKIGETRYVVFTEPTATSPLDQRTIADSRGVGSVGVFSPIVDGRELKFRKRGEKIVDRETGSEWSIFGKAVAGELEGTQLEPINHGVFYAFAWLSFYPDTRVVGGGGTPGANVGRGAAPGIGSRPTPGSISGIDR